MRNANRISPVGTSPAYHAYGFSPAVRCGSTVMTSGLVGLRPDDQMAEGLDEQIELIFGFAKTLLEEAGGNLADITSIDSYHAGDIALHDQMAAFMTIRDRFTDHKPTWTALGVASLAIPGCYIEVKFTAFLPD